MQENLTENRNVNFNETPTTLDETSNQKVPVKIVEDEDVIGKAETSDVGVEMSIETGEVEIQSDSDYASIINSLKEMYPNIALGTIEELVFNAIEDPTVDTAAELIDYVANQLVISTSGSIQTAIGKRYYSVAHDWGVDKVGDNLRGTSRLVKEFDDLLRRAPQLMGTFSENFRKHFGWNVVTDVIIDSYIDINVHGKDISDAIAEATVKSITSYSLFIVSIATVSMLATSLGATLTIPGLALVGGAITIDFLVDVLYDSEITIMNDFSEKLSDGIETITGW